MEDMQAVLSIFVLTLIEGPRIKVNQPKIKY